MCFKLEKGVGEDYRATWPNGLRPGLGLALSPSNPAGHPNKTRRLRFWQGVWADAKVALRKAQTRAVDWRQMGWKWYFGVSICSARSWNRNRLPNQSLRKELWWLSNPKRFLVKLKGDRSSLYLCLLRFVTHISQWVLKFYKWNRDAKVWGRDGFLFGRYKSMSKKKKKKKKE